MRLRNPLKNLPKTPLKYALLASALGIGLTAAQSFRSAAPLETFAATVPALTLAADKTITADIANPDNPGIIEIKAPELARYKRVIAVSDVHGMYYELWHLLLASGVIEMTAAPDTASGADSEKLKWQPQWKGSGNLVIVTGDSIDKGPQSLAVLKLWHDLRQQTKNNNRIVILLGNHEAEYLADPLHKKSLTLHQELIGQGYKPNDLADPAFVTKDGYPLGKFLRSLPLAARVGDWFFSHAGWLPDAGAIAPGQTDPSARWTAFRAQATALVRAGKYADLVTAAGDDADAAPSETQGLFVPILEKKTDAKGKKWWKSEIPTLEAQLTAYGLYGSAFGHNPKAFGLEDAVGVSSSEDYRLIKIDSGLGVPGAPKASDAETAAAWPAPYLGHLLVFPHPSELAQQKAPALQSVSFSRTPVVTAVSVGGK